MAKYQVIFEQSPRIQDRMEGNWSSRQAGNQETILVESGQHIMLRTERPGEDAKGWDRPC